MRDAPGRRETLAGLAALACAASGPARAQAPAPQAPPAAPPEPPPTVDDLLTLDLQEDDGRRLRVATRVDGRGPFPFLIDTGADHSVLSAELAGALGVRPDGSVLVQGIAGAQVRRAASVDRLEVGDRRLENARVALLERQHLGALGLIGLDMLKRERLVIDLAAKRMTVTRSQPITEEPGVVVVRGRSRFGQLILVDSSVRGRKVFVVLDSGAECTLGNSALRAMLYNERMAKGRADPRRAVDLLSVTGQTLAGELDVMAELTLGGVTIREVPIVYAELDTFRRFGLLQAPAIMLGMDTLAVFRQVSIDFGRREVGFALA